MGARTLLFIVLALTSFAANSVLCRAALETGAIDAASFTAIRLAAGAMALWALVLLRRPSSEPALPGSWTSAAMLFLYAIAFSIAYLSLSAGTGALILFGAVQCTMIGWGLARGERPGPRVWIGLALAFGGLVALVLPGLTAPDPIGAALMAVAGIAWGVYSLRGSSADAAGATAGNFVRAAPLGLVPVFAFLGSLSASPAGVAYAAASGAITSGLGYVAWYAALPELGPTRAGIVQLAAPVLVAAAGVVLLGEDATVRLAICAAVMLGGVALASLRRVAAAKGRTSQET